MEENIDDKEVDYVYDNYYFKLNKKLQICTGLWPYKSHTYKLIRRIVLYATLFLAMIPLCNGFRVWCGVKLDVCGENVLGILYTLTIFLKFWITTYSEEKLKNIYKRVAKNWLETTDPNEHAILLDYAKQGRIKTVGYMVYMTTAGICFCQIPMIPKIMDVLMPLNESRPTILFVKGEFIINPYQNFYKLYFYFMFASAFTVMAVTSIDTTYTVIVHQILGIFSIIKYRLHLATVSLDPLKDISYDIIIRAIRLHKQVLQFVDLIEKSYRIFFLIIMGFTVLFISFCVVILMINETILDCLRFTTLLFGVILHFLFITWPGQKVIDHSYELFKSTYENEWYNVSERSKRLIAIIMLRSIKPCIFTAGGLYVMNLENFGSMMKSAASYIAVVASFR